MISGIHHSITEDELLLGDIIFFMDYSGKAEHVAIYAGKKNDTHFITHGVSKPYDSIMTTRLKPDAFPYRVFRCKDFNLSTLATYRMLSWVKTGIDFSYQKTDGIYSGFVDSKNMCHPKDGGYHQAEAIKKDFPIIFYRYIAMASHPKTPFMINNSQAEGMRCSEALVSAFNIETLLSAEAVKSTKNLGVHWVSDKTLLPTDKIQSEFHPSDQYWEYFKRTNSVDEYQPYGNLPENAIPDGYVHCSLHAWDYKKYPSIEEFIEHYPFSLPMDSKLATAWAMMTHMEQTPALWIEIGNLTVAKKDYPLAEMEVKKDAWKNYVLNLFEHRKQSRDQPHLSSSCSELNNITMEAFDDRKPYCQGRTRSMSFESAFSFNPISVEQKAKKSQFDRAFPYVSPVKPSSTKKYCANESSCPRKLKF